jgi:hypothetical protein
MSSKTLNKRKKSRGLKNRTKKHMRKYLGGGKYYDSNGYLRQAQSELGSLRGPGAALRPLKKLLEEYPNQDLEDLIKKVDLSDLIHDLEDSGNLLTDALDKINDLISKLNDDN